MVFLLSWPSLGHPKMPNRRHVLQQLTLCTGTGFGLNRFAVAFCFSAEFTLKNFHEEKS
jgi:hypothetical protein